MTFLIDKYIKIVYIFIHDIINRKIQKQQAQIDQLVSKLASAERKATTLQNQIEQLLRRLYGRKSEKIDPRQLRFDSLILESWKLNGDPEPPPPPPKPDPSPKKGGPDPRRKRRKFGRISIPDNFERVEIVLDIPEDQKVDPKTGAPLKHIGDDISEKIDFVPSKLIVNVYRRPKYAAPDSLSVSGPGVITAPMPDQWKPLPKDKHGLILQP
jgi:hypothetical protein